MISFKMWMINFRKNIALDSRKHGHVIISGTIGKINEMMIHIKLNFGDSKLKHLYH